MEITPEQYHQAVELIRKYKEQLRSELDMVEAEHNRNLYPGRKYCTLMELVEIEEISLRLHNVIKHNLDDLGIQIASGQEPTVGDLKGVSVLKLQRCRNAGAKTVKEFKRLCEQSGIMWKP